MPEKPVEVASQENTPKENPLDGNDWMENTDGTFTLKKSYLDEAAFKRSLEEMPYHDLDLYTFPGETLDSLLTELPRLSTGSLTLIPSLLTDSFQLENFKLKT